MTTQKQREYMAKWYREHPAYVLEYRRHHAQRRREVARNWWAKQAKLKTNQHIAKNLRTRICQALKGTGKFRSSLKLIGCSLEKLRSYIEGQFKPGMSWKNYGDWHIDHKLPCASFNLSIPEEQQSCFHYTNLQPLWAAENVRKGIGVCRI